jgi:hypothetical protein
MGTNYYAHLDVCKTCGSSEEVVHLGKSSAGWRFLFNFHAGRYYKDYPELLNFLDSEVDIIKTEYGEEVEINTFLALVLRKSIHHNHADRWDNQTDRFGIVLESSRSTDFS